jgi:hypothetical protein
MILQSMPDSKWNKLKEYLTVGERYEILGTIGNGFIIHPKKSPDPLLVLQSRFSND